ncbi:MAG: hypothetical protein RL208_695 [Pseudomonadota bacterium]|jgi:hypothetical protein
MSFFGGGQVDKSVEKKIERALVRYRLLSREKAKKLVIALKKNKIQAIKLFKSLGLSGRTVQKLTLELKRCGLNLEERKLVLKFLKDLTIAFSKDMFCPLSIDRISHLWHRLPITLRSLILAIVLLKQEIVHLFQLRLERDKKRIIEVNKLQKVQISLSSELPTNVLYRDRERAKFLPQVDLHRNVASDEKQYSQIEFNIINHNPVDITIKTHNKADYNKENTNVNNNDKVSDIKNYYGVIKNDNLDLNKDVNTSG